MIRSHATAAECVRVAKIVRQALASGQLVRPSTCSWCGEAGQIHGHHPDYDRPLMVVWICAPCHREHHARYWIERQMMLGEIAGRESALHNKAQKVLSVTKSHA